jgi:3-oxoacyl-[acyl-carrier protein] reductase
MIKSLENQIALVTGGGTGIGRGICIDLARNGARVIVTGRRADKLEETRQIIEEQGGYAECYKMDVSNANDINSVIQEVYNKFKNLHILICNAGNLTSPAFAVDMVDEDWDTVLKTHLYGTFYCIKSAGKIMKEKKYGRIVIMSSVAEKNGFTGSVNYAASKAALQGITQTLAKEMGPFGITVNCIQPGIIRTPMAEGFLEAMEDTFIEETPVKRIGKPEDIANAVSFFCMPQSEFITGIIMRVDGGYMLQTSMDKFVYGLC